MLKASVVLATFDQPQELRFVLSALMRQSESQFEILLADDGSGPATKSVIEEFKNKLNIKHFWQPHQGFRKSRILNQAIRAAQADVLIFLDGDCVPHSDFIEQHIRLQEKGFYVAGRRVDLSKEFTSSLSIEALNAGALDGKSFTALWRLWLDSQRPEGSTPFHRAYMVRTKWLRKICGLERVVDLKGCNFSVSRSDMLAIDGFDESYEGYGREDTDVELRLQHLGRKIKSAKNLCLQFHLWHERRGFTPANEKLLAEVTQTKRIKALRGISTLD
jgi:glycosyltransferase involved in cell wall biosynthesis